MLIKVGKLVELANMNSLTGSKGYTGEAQGATDSTRAKTEGVDSSAREGKLARKLVLILGLWYQAD